MRGGHYDREEFIEKVDRLLSRLCHEFVSLHESEIVSASIPSRPSCSFNELGDGVLSDGEYDLNFDRLMTRDHEALPHRAKRIRQDVMHSTALASEDPMRSRAESEFTIRTSASSTGVEELGPMPDRLSNQTESRGVTFIEPQPSSNTSAYVTVDDEEPATTHHESDETKSPRVRSAKSVWKGMINDAVETNGPRCIFLEAGIFYCGWSLQLYVFVAIAAWADTLGFAQDWGNGTGPLGKEFDLLAFLVFSLDVLINFNTSFEDEEGIVILDRIQIFKHYLKGWFLFDVIVAFPYDWLAPDSEVTSARAGKIMKSLKLIRLLKIVKMSSSTQSSLYVLATRFDDKLSQRVDDSLMQAILKRSRLLKAMLKYSLLLFFESHILACVLLNAENNGNSTTFEFQAIPSEDLNPWLSYFAVFRWTLVGCATGMTGENSFKFSVPHVDPQVLRISLTFIFVANMMIGFSMFSNVKGSDDMDLSYRLRMLAIYLRKRKNVSRHSRNAVVQYHKSQAARGRAREIIKLLTNVPQHLRQKIAFETYAEQLLKFCLFRQGPLKRERKSEMFLLALCQRLQGRFFIAKETVVERKSKYEGMYCRIDGKLRESRGAESMFDQIGSFCLDNTIAGADFFGMEALFAPLSSSWQISRNSVVSVGQSEVALLSRRHFDDVVDGSHEWTIYFNYVRSKVVKDRLLLQDIANIGLSDDSIQEFRHFRDRASHASYELGISVKYIINDFVDDVRSAVDGVDIDSCTFNDLKECFWNEDHRGFKGSATQVCPRDGLPGSAIVDALDRTCKGKATHFVSWCWRYSVRSVVSALKAWAGDNDVTSVCLWMCFFCNNQRSLLVDGEHVNLVDTFGQRLEQVGNMIVLLDRYDSPFYATRLWCIFEAYTATVKSIPVGVALPEESLCEFTEVVKAPFGFFSIMRKLTNIDTEKAEASMKEDEDIIRDLIRNSIGFQAVNATVRAAITRWLASAFEQVVTDMEDAPVAFASKRSLPSVEEEVSV